LFLTGLTGIYKIELRDSAYNVYRWILRILPGIYKWWTEG